MDLRVRPYRYPLAVFLVAASVAIKLVVGREFFLDKTAFQLSFAAVIISAWVGGFGPGVLATILAALASNWFFLSPQSSLAISNPGTEVRFALFVLESLLISGVAGALHSARAHAVTLREQAAAELARRAALESQERAARRQLEVILRNVADGITAQSADGKLIFANDAAVRATGFSSIEELIGAMPVDRLAGFELLDVDGSPMDASLLPGRTAIRTGLPQTREVAFRLRRTGEVRSSIVHSVPVPGPDGKPELVINVFHDMTEAKRASAEREKLLSSERAAREQTEASRAREAFLAEAGEVLASSLDYGATLQSLARLVVPRFADWCGIDMLEKGVRKRLAVAHADPTRVDAAIELEERYPTPADAPTGIAAVLRTGIAERVDGITDEMLQKAAKDPEHLRLLRSLGLTGFICVPLRSRGRVIGALTLALAESGRHYGEAELAFAEELARRAGTAIENAELYRDAQQANRAKDEFLATLSHELRTPLHAILGWARMLNSGALPEATKEKALDSIERNARVQTQLVDDLLDVSRIITGKLRIDTMPVELPPIVEAALDSVRPAAEAKRIRIDVDLDPAAPLVNGDPDRLQQIVWNLAANAIKFTKPGGRVRVSLTARGKEAEFCVSDDGKGIPPAFLPYVFDRFRQADSSTTRQFGGLGLGLAIVRHLVELHGGVVSAESEGEGKGATFRVRLPAATGVSRLAPPAEEARADGGLLLRGARLLVVDDEVDSLELLRSVLEQAGAQVETAAGGAAALDAVAARRFDLVLTDIGMPAIDGYEFLRRFRMTARGRELPVLALTAYASVEDRRRVLEAGFARHVTKPIDPQDLTRVAASLLQRN